MIFLQNFPKKIAFSQFFLLKKLEKLIIYVKNKDFC